MLRLGKPPVSGIKYVDRPGVYCILPKAGRILATYQDDPHFEFQLPGGGVDPSESLLPALHREVLEETGWCISKPVHLATYQRFCHMPEYEIWAKKICHIFVARPCFEIHPPTEMDHTTIWMDIESALSELDPEVDRMALRYFLS